MIIVGAKGFAKEILEIQYQLRDIGNLVFYDDVNKGLPKRLYDTYLILTDIEAAKNYFKTVESRYTIGIGNPILRKKMYEKFQKIGGELISTISPKASIGHHGITISKGCNIMDQAVLSNDIYLGIGCLIYFNAMVTHDVKLGDFVQISPGASLLGRGVIGDYSEIGSNATILPDVIIGKNVIVAAGSVVTKNIPDNCMVAGVPAVIKKQLVPLEY